MGILSSLFNRPPKLTVFDLIYARMRVGSEWGDKPPTWNMKNCYDNYGFAKSWDRIQKLDLVTHADSKGRLSSLTIPALKEILKAHNLSVSGKKAALVDAILALDDVESICSTLPDIVAWTDTGADLFAKHDYIPYVIQHCKEIPCGHKKMFDLRERNPHMSKYDILVQALNEESFYGEGCYDEEDKQYARECRRYAKRDYRDYVEAVRKAEAAEHANDSPL